MDRLIIEVKELLSKAHIDWAVCGGYALDLFLDKPLRTHSDIDICVFESDRDKILRYMLQNNWCVYEFRGQGKVRPLNSTIKSDIGRNLMCVKDECDLVTFHPCEDMGLFYHNFFHTGIKAFNYIEFLFNQTRGDQFLFDKKENIQRSLSKSILYNNTVAYLAPEIVLLYKASQAERADYHFDFEQTYPHLSDEQKQWFSSNLDVLYPNGHKWKLLI